LLGVYASSRVATIAEARGISMAQIALAWVLAQPGVSAPIVGSTSISHLEDLAASVHIELSPDEIEAISSPYRPQAIVRLTPASLCAPCRPP
jgi:aryl-alcohol dehydrogenase-like predicted oxidoreductase